MEEFSERMLEGLVYIIGKILTGILWVIGQILLSIILGVLIRGVGGILGFIFYLPYQLIATELNTQKLTNQYRIYRKKTFDDILLITSYFLNY